jgi:catechol 2,3-dioxygenase-like lactoylglutathione lyase family enzyme
MNVNHLHLHVKDVERTKRFFESWLGFRETIRHGEILFLGNEDGFDLALAPDPSPAPMPPWFHFGFRLATRGAVRDLHDRMRSAGVTIRKELYDDGEFASFRCQDPDGYSIEIYWE